MRKLIEVTKKDIRRAGPGAALCPIAQALTRIGYHGVMVAQTYVASDEWTYGPLLPRRAQSFIKSYDLSDKPVRPFRFYLDVPEES